MHPFALLLVRLVLGSMWIVAGRSKLVSKAPRGQSVADYGLLPRSTAMMVGMALPWVESTLGLLLLVGQWTTAAAAASAGLLVIFSIAIIVNLVRGRKIECTCFGQSGRTPISWLSVVRNGGLLVAALAVVLVGSDYLSLDGWQRGTALVPTDPPVLDFAPVLLMALTGGLVWTLAVSAWQVAQAVAKADGGPALGMPERPYLRRWMGLGASQAEADNRR